MEGGRGEDRMCVVGDERGERGGAGGRRESGESSRVGYFLFLPVWRRFALLNVVLCDDTACC